MAFGVGVLVGMGLMALLAARGRDELYEDLDGNSQFTARLLSDPAFYAEQRRSGRWQLDPPEAAVETIGERHEAPRPGYGPPRII